MTIFDQIKKDHDKHRELLNILADTEGDSKERRQIWETFFYDVKAHAAAEEETLYSKLIATEDGQPDSRHAIHEHHILDKKMDELNETDMASPGWLMKLKTLKHDYEHHMAEEESDIFPRAKQELGEDPAHLDGSQFNNRKSSELEIVDLKAEEAIKH